MSLKVTIALILFALFIQYIEGFERVIVVTESHVAIDEEDNFTTKSGNISNLFKQPCCINGNCSCPSLHSALDNLRNNFVINITSDVELFSNISRSYLTNITITGHNNPTVNCNNSGGLQFIYCYNCTISGITWKQCGARNIIDGNGTIYPVLQLTNSSNVTIQNCSFLHSAGQTVLLSEISGNMKISYCNFLYNKQYEGHGTAIHYSSNVNSLVKFN